MSGASALWFLTFWGLSSSTSSSQAWLICLGSLNRKPWLNPKKSLTRYLGPWV